LAGFYVVLEVSGRGSAFCENGSSVSVSVVVDDFNSFFKRVSSEDTDYGSENFGLVGFHVGFTIVDDGGSNEVSVRVLFIFVVSSI